MCYLYARDNRLLLCAQRELCTTDSVICVLCQVGNCSKGYFATLSGCEACVAGQYDDDVDVAALFGVTSSVSSTSTHLDDH
jgi:hypothetical protein